VQNFSSVSYPYVAVSPDGSQIVYVANGQLFLRSMSEFDSRAIPTAEGAGIANPVFSPDGRSIAFVSATERAIKVIGLSGGQSVRICSIDDPPFGLTWNREGIVFGAAGKGIMRVLASGGTPETLVKLNPDEKANVPQILPGGEAILYALASGGAEQWRRSQIVVQSLKTGERRTLLSGAFARYVPTGHIIYVALSPSGGTLFAVPFDAKQLKVTGEAVAVVEGVRRSVNNGIAQYSFSQTGTLVYVPGTAAAASGQSGLAFVDKNGGIEPLNIPPAAFEHPRVSPDGKQVVYTIDTGKETDVWIYDLSNTSAPRKLTFGGRNRFPIWSGNGKQIAFQSDRERDAAIYLLHADLSGIADRLTKPNADEVHIPESWSHDNNTLLYTVTKDSVVSLWTLSMRDKRAAEFPGIQSATPTDAVFSPDGRWFAYVASPTGRALDPQNVELYVQPFPPTGEKDLISSLAGIHPVWSQQGELLFNFPGQLMSVNVITHPVFTTSTPVRRLRAGIAMPWPAQRSYDVLPDGRLLGIVALADNGSAAQFYAITPRIRIVENWFEELKQRVPSKR
jgi:Tol biopolymer transport system component